MIRQTLTDRPGAEATGSKVLMGIGKMHPNAVPDLSRSANRQRPLAWRLRLAVEAGVLSIFIVALAARPLTRYLITRLSALLPTRGADPKFDLRRQAD
jgi:hypothetical protein